jgi:hypothetical protein
MGDIDSCQNESNCVDNGIQGQTHDTNETEWPEVLARYSVPAVETNRNESKRILIDSFHSSPSLRRG